MLPDFAHMVRVPLVAVRDHDIQRGIDLHHRTDEAFHRTPFVLVRLTDALRRRPALALLEDQSALVAEFLPSLQHMVERNAPELLNGLQDALGLEY